MNRDRISLSWRLRLKRWSPARLLCKIGVHDWIGREGDFCSRWGCGAVPVWLQRRHRAGRSS